ncbi:MAG TPA: acylneuraminate cytidylyltransferase family protein, partial [Flavobacterium sp.]|nr:acylneuraminate cytidylyltransferase family protein [Flavobacterium sp.]
QDLDPLYFENGLLYILKASLVKSGKIISTNALPYEINHIFGQADIDTLDDFKYAEYLLAKSIS